MLIILDFDHTLFNTSKFKKELFSCLADLGIDSNLFTNTYHQVVNRQQGSYDWDINVHLQCLQKDTNFPLEAGKKRIEEVINGSAKYLYSDAKWFLKRLNEDNHKLLLASWGNVDFQKKKIQNTGIKKYFERVILSQKSKKQSLERVIKDADQLIFITDNPKEMKIVIKDSANIIPILSKRRNAKEYAQPIKDIPTFPNLKLLYKFINQLSQIKKPASFNSQILFSNNQVIVQFSKKLT